MSEETRIELERKGDQLLARIGDDKEARPVKIVWARPISGRGREVSVLAEGKEVAFLKSLDELEPAARKLAGEELEQRYLIPKITRVLHTDVDYGDRTLRVETNRGAMEFLIKDVNRNVVWLSEDRAIIRDVLGNRYEIPSVAQLDAASKVELDRVL